MLWKGPAFNLWGLTMQIYPLLKVRCQTVDDFKMTSQTLNATRGQVGAGGKRLVGTSNSLNIENENLPLSGSGQANNDLLKRLVISNKGY
jgi:hypothetical protein